MKVPLSLGWWREVPGGAAWLDELPLIAAVCAERWSLRMSVPLDRAHMSLVIPAELPDGSQAILKVNFPDTESEHEPDALAHWNGRGAARLLASDDKRRALLVVGCIPGSQLWSVEDDEEATRTAAAVLARLWRPPPDTHRFGTLLGEAAKWARELPDEWDALDKPFERELVDEAVATCIELGSDQGEHVLLHQDFHGGNVLRAEREPWLAIDPKPLVGECEFDAASLLRDRRWLLGRPDDAARIRRRLDLLTSELDLDRERMRRWGIAYALAWGFSGRSRKVEGDMIECARLLVSART